MPRNTFRRLVHVSLQGMNAPGDLLDFIIFSLMSRILREQCSEIKEDSGSAILAFRLKNINVWQKSQ
jgi:hypothetical protein